MSILRKEELKKLGEHRAGPCVSIYIPTHRSGPETQQDPIRLKNQLTAAEKRLIDDGIRSVEARQILEPAQALLADEVFWRYQSDGLALFLAPNFFQFYTLPIDFAELSVIAQSFHLKPLRQLFTYAGTFYILALSQNAVRLFQGTEHRIQELFPLGIPDSLDDALKLDDPQKHLQFHTGGSSQSATGGSVFHGHGGGADESKDQILRYCRAIDTGLRPLLRNESAPLVMASVEYLHPLYQEANTYAHLSPEVIAGNPEELSAAELHERAWKIVQPQLQKAQDVAVAKYHQLAGTGQTATDLTEVIQAVAGGRVASLIVAVGVQRWGTVDPATNVATIHDEFQTGDEDLLDWATTMTLMNGGEVFVVGPETVPDQASLAAVFRY